MDTPSTGEFKNNKFLVLVIVYVSFLMDNILLTVVGELQKIVLNTYIIYIFKF